jgi:2,4-dienoyl-CoA reductase-like NADH-dependent reductase (Old Yellow Enzyme family)
MLPHLFQPFDLGPFVLRNRLICTGHNPHYDSDGLIGPQQLAFHVRKAQGGIAMSVTGGTSVHPSGGMLPISPLINFDDSVIPGYHRLAEAMHAEGARMLVQLGHAASAIHHRFGEHALWAQSQTIGEYALELPHVMTRAEMQALVEAFYQAARRVRQSGLDGVELNVFSGSLLQQVLSPVTNRRTDEYGGSLENRLRFLIEVIQACREALGDASALALKIAGDELYPAGLHLPEMQEIVRAIDRVARVDLYVVASGTNLERFPRVDHWPPAPAPHGLRVELARGIKAATGRPVAALCRIVDPRMAERLVAEGACDLVAIVRATLADPDIASKAAEGRFDDIRPCVGANSGCVDRIIAGGQARCIYNPIIGREAAWGQMDRAAVVRKVVVVGGGPAGLEAARVAAERGHRVVLFERTRELGGAALLMARKPGREELGGIPRWLAGQVKKLGVDVRLATEASPEAVVAERPDVVILATGARDTAPTPSAAEAGLPVVSARAVLGGEAPPGRNVLIVDHFGYDTGCAVAELAADRGGQAEVISRHFHPAVDFGLTNTISLYRRLFAKGVMLTAHSDLAWAREGRIAIRNVYGGAERVRAGLDQLVMVTAPTPNTELLEPLREAGLTVEAVGDCVAPRDVERATFEAHRVARTI